MVDIYKHRRRLLHWFGRKREWDSASIANLLDACPCLSGKQRLLCDSICHRHTVSRTFLPRSSDDELGNMLQSDCWTSGTSGMHIRHHGLQQWPTPPLVQIPMSMSFWDRLPSLDHRPLALHLWEPSRRCQGDGYNHLLQVRMDFQSAKSLALAKDYFL